MLYIDEIRYGTATSADFKAWTDTDIAGVRKTDTGCEISPSLKVLSEFDAEVPLSENLSAKVAWKDGVLTVDADCDILLKLPCGMKVEGLAGNGEYRLSAGRYFLTIIS